MPLPNHFHGIPKYSPVNVFDGDTRCRTARHISPPMMTANQLLIASPLGVLFDMEPCQYELHEDERCIMTMGDNLADIINTIQAQAQTLLFHYWLNLTADHVNKFETECFISMHGECYRLFGICNPSDEPCEYTPAYCPISYRYAFGDIPVGHLLLVAVHKASKLCIYDTHVYIKPKVSWFIEHLTIRFRVYSSTCIPKSILFWIR